MDAEQLRSQFPDSPHATNARAAAHDPRSVGSSGSNASRACSTGGAGEDATNALAPSTNRVTIDRDRSFHRSASCKPSRLNPTTRANRSCGTVRSPKSSDSRPVAARSAASIWNSRSEAVTNPCANHRSSSDAAKIDGTPQESR
jgi:hypothetical protein